MKGSAHISILATTLLVLLLASSALPAFGCSADSDETAMPASVPGVMTALLGSTTSTLSPSAVAAFEAEKARAAKHARIQAEQGRGAGRTTASAATRGQTSEEGSSGTATGTAPAGGSSPGLTSPEPSPATAEEEGTTSAVLTGGRTPLRGLWNGTAERLASYLLATRPSPRFTVPASVLAEYYVRYAAEAGLRADLLWAQMLHETGYGMYGGSVVPEQNNFAGIGATGGGEPGVWFTSAEAGVMAHIAHLVAYVYASSPVEWANAAVDPRFDMVNPKGAASVLAHLNGRWAVPGTTYGEAIEGIAREINSIR